MGEAARAPVEVLAPFWNTPAVSRGVRLPFRRAALGSCLVLSSLGCTRESDGVAGSGSPTGPFSCETLSGAWQELALLRDQAGEPRLELESALATGNASATQRLDAGAASRRTELRIPLLCRSTRLGPLGGLSLAANVTDPETLDDEPRTIAVVDARIERGALLLLVDGPISEGSTLHADAGLLEVAGAGEVPSATTAGARSTLSGAGLSSARAAARWFKAFQPRDVELFPDDTYPSSAPVDAGVQSHDGSAVSASLRAHCERKVARGFLSRARADELLGLFDAAASGRELSIAELFASPSGELQVQLLAATLATAGTVFESAIPAILFGENVSGAPIRVLYDGQLGARLPPGASAAMYTRSDGRLWLVVHERFRREPFAAIAPTIGHEVFHQDRANGREEESCAKVGEAVAWAQMLLAEPELAGARTTETRFFNLELLWLLNSGNRGYPNPGFFPAPLAEAPPNVHPSSARRHESFKAVVDEIYGDVPARATPGNPHLREVARRLSGTDSESADFSERTLRNVFDDVRALDEDEQFELLTILRLESVTL